MSSESPHFDGPTVAGGHAYALREILSVEPPASIATGVKLLDDWTGGIAPGEVWTISGPAGVGVTSLAATIAAHAAASSDVIMCNGHVPSRRLATTLDVLCAPSARLRLSSWFRLLLEPPEPLADTSLQNADLLVVDTWDETWHTAAWPDSHADLVRRLRWLRWCARESATAILLTARTPTTATNGILGQLSAAFADVADVRITLDDRALVHIRGLGTRAVQYRPGSRGSVLLVAQDEPPR